MTYIKAMLGIAFFIDFRPLSYMMGLNNFKLKLNTMADKFHPSNVLNFSIQHEIILLLGGTVCVLLTLYVIKKIYRNMTIGLLIDVRKLSFYIFIRKKLTWSIIRDTLFLLLISWGILILILISAPLEGIIILPAFAGALVSLMTFCRIKSSDS